MSEVGLFNVQENPYEINVCYDFVNKCLVFHIFNWESETLITKKYSKFAGGVNVYTIMEGIEK